jgi:hypothetical protein
MPCARSLRTLVNRLDPALSGSCLNGWIRAPWPDQHDPIAVDGKTTRRPHDKRKGIKALHTLSGYATYPGSSWDCSPSRAISRPSKPKLQTTSVPLWQKNASAKAAEIEKERPGRAALDYHQGAGQGLSRTEYADRCPFGTCLCISSAALNTLHLKFPQHAHASRNLQQRAVDGTARSRQRPLKA